MCEENSNFCKDGNTLYGNKNGTVNAVNLISIVQVDFQNGNYCMLGSSQPEIEKAVSSLAHLRNYLIFYEILQSWVAESLFSRSSIFILANMTCENNQLEEKEKYCGKMRIFNKAEKVIFASRRP